MTDAEVLHLAQLKEEAAIKMYQKLLAEHPNLKDLLNLLVTEEQKHKALIERKFVELSGQ